MYWSRNKYIIAAFLIFSYLIISCNAFAKVKTKNAVINIATCADLQNINNQLTGEYVLTGDIDCTGFKFSPIGAPYSVFGGILDGAGHTIKNLTIYSTNDYVGLFREAKYASISRLTLENVNISGESSEGGSAVGGLIGEADHARVEEVQVQGTVTVREPDGNGGGLIGNGEASIRDSSTSVDIEVPLANTTFGVGGLGGRIAGTIIRSSATGPVNVAQGVGHVGGLIGDFVGSINDSYATGTVTSAGGADIGGLVGSFNGGSITNSYATGDIKGSNNILVGGLIGQDGSLRGVPTEIIHSHAEGAVTGVNYVGGLIGVASGTATSQDQTIRDSYATGFVSGSNFTGGLVGYIQGKIYNSYATGPVKGSKSTGGLVGQAVLGNISNSYATGSVTGLNNTGGLIGNKMDVAVVTNSYSIGAVSGSTTTIGGLIGYGSSANISSSYWDTQTSGQATSAGGVGKTTAEMYQQSTYVNWDFAQTWNIHEGNSYPWLRATNFEIKNCAELQAIQQNLTGAYRLVADIDCTGTPVSPIGTSELPFTGALDGEGYSVLNVGIKADSQAFVGLFGATRNAQIINLVLKNISVSGQKNTGALIGYAYEATQVANVTADGAVVAAGSTDLSDIGGLIGGMDSQGSLTHSMANITVNAANANFVGGLVGQNSGWISNSYALGNVSGLGNVGGMTGDNEGSLTFTYAAGKVTGNNKTGGLVGTSSAGTVSSSYWDTDVSGQTSSAGGTGKTTAEMYKQSTYDAWDFNNIWDINEGYSYPWLRNQTAQTSKGVKS